MLECEVCLPNVNLAASSRAPQIIIKANTIKCFRDRKFIDEI